jgi:large subunit ribosomal protein L13
MDTGDFIIIINAEKVLLTGNKLKQKKYYHHSGYPGGLRETAYSDLMVKKPTLVLEKAVKGMLPHNRLGRATAKKLKVYAGGEHPHAAQQPQIWEWDL